MHGALCLYMGHRHRGNILPIPFEPEHSVQSHYLPTSLRSKALPRLMKMCRDGKAAICLWPLLNLPNGVFLEKLQKAMRQHRETWTALL
jgi:hypothetical protein